MKTRDSDLYWAATKAIRFVRSPFLAEQLLASAEKYLDAPIPDKRAFGPVIRSMLKDGTIRGFGFDRAVTSNGSWKPRYMRYTP